MKPLPFLLAASLAANAAFVAHSLIRPSSAESAARRDASSPAPAPVGPTDNARDAAAHTHIIAALKADDAAALRDLLREAGLSDDTVRMIVQSAIWKRYHQRIKALNAKPAPDQPWWQRTQWQGSNLSHEQRAEQRRLRREASDEIARVLGPEKDPSGTSADARLGFVPEAKRRELQEIEQDYQELLQDAQQEMQGFTLPSDVEKIRFLQEEKMRDLAALLTPEELADYELRLSPTANQLRWKMSKFDGTEDEYRKIFAAQKAFNDTQTTDAWGNPITQGPDDWKKRHEGEQRVAEQIKAALGPDRYADYLRSQNHEYQQLAAAAKRLALPPETATQVYNLRDDVSAESQRIADDASLDIAQKKKAFADLANRTREQVRASLGPEAADAYLKSGMSWLATVEQGNVVTFSENGSRSTRSGLSPVR